MADTEMAEFLRVNGIGGVALEPLVEERLTRAAHSQRTAGDVFAEESVQVRLSCWFASVTSSSLLRQGAGGLPQCVPCKEQAHAVGQ